MERKLPRVDILGTEYSLDIKAQRLFPLHASPTINEISLSSFEVLFEEDYELVAYYDSRSKNVVDIPYNATEVPKGMDLVGIKLPSLFEMDPVGCAEAKGKKYENSNFSHFPIKDIHKAEIIPFAETSFAMQISEHAKHSSNPQPEIGNKVGEKAIKKNTKTEIKINKKNGRSL